MYLSLSLMLTIGLDLNGVCLDSDSQKNSDMDTDSLDKYFNANHSKYSGAVTQSGSGSESDGSGSKLKVYRMWIIKNVKNCNSVLLSQSHL
jgi:hypothetical protein